MLKLFQIRLTREVANRVNAGETHHPIYKAHCDASMLGKFPGREFYAHVADVGTDDLDKAFEIGNIGPEGLLTRHAPMHSISVGDVLVDAKGVAHMVQSLGFGVVEGWQ